jgi:enoyl-CoA hydratase
MALIEVEVAGKIGTLVLNRPEKLNAFSPDMFVEFDAGLKQLTADAKVKVIIIRGAGRAFSVGNDVAKGGSGYEAGKHEHDPVADSMRLRKRMEMWLDIRRCPKPVIAQVHGFCIGVATQLAVCCDITVVSEDAHIGWPAVPLGSGYLSPFSAWLIGPKKAKELSFIAGSRMSGVEAVAWGWANRAVPLPQLSDTTLILARQISKTPSDLLAIKKRALNRVMDVQGFSESVLMGAEFDAMGHGSKGAQKTKAAIAKLGLKETMRRFREEDDGLDLE